MAVNEGGGRILPIDVEKEMRRSYLDYAMSVIVDRALPDVRDGLKPVQRRILYAMMELGLRPDQPHRKSARITGDVMGKYHPHGDAAIYDAMVRMAQDFSFRYPLVDGHGNFGSVDGDPPAHMRYTEARLSPVALEMLRDIDKETVDFGPNFDGNEEQPAVLPARFPNLLVNGAAGIAVGMATNIPPHNLGEVVDALVRLIDKPDTPAEDLFKIVKGPDFPTGALILGRDAIRQAYLTGRGHIRVRAKTEIEEMDRGRYRIVVHEIPYMVNKAQLIERIAALAREKRVEGITDLRDESDRSGMRIAIELRRDANPRVVLNQLLKHSQLEETFGAIMIALVDGEPRVLTLREMLTEYLKHQRQVVERRTRYELRKAEERAHILEGLRIALAHLDEIIRLIRRAPDEPTAKQQLMERYGLSDRQAQAILEMQLRRLTNLEREKIEQEYQELVKRIADLKAILADEGKLFGVIRTELQEVRGRFADPRRTQIVADEPELETEDLIAEQQVVVTLTRLGYVKRLPVDTYRAQRRGGRGITAVHAKEGDFVERLFVASTHSYVLFFTNRGRVYRVRAHEIPEGSRTARGTAAVNVVPLQPEEQVTATIAIREYDEGHHLVMVTRKGTVKKTVLSEFDTPRNGIICITLDEDDDLVDVLLTDGSRELVLVTAHGQAIRFPEEDVRPMGRAARGVRGIRLEPGDRVVSAGEVQAGSELLVVTANGYGKRTALDQYRRTARGGKGIRTLNLTDKTGEVIDARVVRPEEEAMLISSRGVMIRISVGEVSVQGRITQGVRLMRLAEGEQVVAAGTLIGARAQEIPELEGDEG
ncbi:DNA gyrase subunit A [Limnochorda pilosa]|uniref:DNA gyrase subunit A n=1 Tax=Limnochorda pilosa TaxID=1555112 RepID=A0A0K2SFJ2_LIMPI|nr:DNA gyrase subunit A [Limnochorda pilosa]BAS25868.1 DNA gyrase subunit A [Limnochorda pilosa]